MYNPNKNLYNKWYSARNIVIFLLQCNMLLIVFSPDVYMGIADYYYFIFLICLISINKLFSFHRQLYTSEKFIIFFLFWQIIVTVVSVFSFGNISSGYILSYLLYLLLFLILLEYRLSHLEIKRVLTSYMWSGVLVGFLIIFYRKTFYDGEERFTVQILDHDMFDPNFLGALMVIPFILSFSKLICKSSIKYLLSSIIILVGLLMTASRGAMLSSSIGCLFVAIQLIKGKMNIKSFFYYGIASLGIIVAIFYFLPEGSYERLFVNSYDDSSNTKRILDWRNGLLAFEKSPIFGYGYNGEMAILKQTLNISLIAHNTYIAFLLQFGIIGCSIYLSGIIGLIKTMSLHKEYSLIGMLFATLFVNIFISGEVAVFFWFPIIFLTLIINCIQRNKKLTYYDFV